MMAGRMVGDADEHSLMVKEAVGESLSLTQAIAVIMMGVSGLLMWWQLKTTRRVGFLILVLSAVAATAIGFAMHAAMTG